LQVSDFGLSRLISNETPIIETRSYGTVTFMPAELLLEGRMSKAVDVYSWGVIVWEMYSGCRPFAGMSHSQVLHAIGMGRQLQLPEHMPKGLRDLLEACMARDPAKRWVGRVLTGSPELEGFVCFAAPAGSTVTSLDNLTKPTS